MPAIVLTDLSIRALKSKDAQVDYWDEKTPGFGMRVGSKRKTFVAKLNNRRITIGVSPDLSLADARRKALALKSDKTAGLKRSVKFSVALKAFYETHLPTLKENTQKALKRNLERHFPPVFKNKKLEDIWHKQVSDITDALATKNAE